MMSQEFKNNDNSPEENLLRHIRQQKTGERRTLRTSKPKTAALWPEEGQKTTWFRLANRFLILLIIVFLGYSIYEIAFNKKEISDLNLEATERQIVSPVKEGTFEPAAKPYGYYSKDFLERDIFESGIYRPEERGTEISSNAPEFLKKLKLVGILLGDNSEAIIEDLETKQTLFLYKGEQVKEATVEDIEESKVLLRSKDQLIELMQ